MSQPALPPIDATGFAEAISALHRQAMARLGPADLAHLGRIIWVNRLCTLLGYASAWLCPNPLSAYLISQGIFGRWLITHHVTHGGYDHVPGVPARYTSAVFAQGWRRWRDWFDWIVPRAWDHEHNLMHHAYTGELADPDLVEDHAALLRRLHWPRWANLVFVAFFACTWKIIYYAPNTLAALARGQVAAPPAGDRSLARLIWEHGFDLRRPLVRRLWRECYLPYAIVAFVVLPLAFSPLGWWAVFSVLVNRLLAEAMTNAHAFLVIGPNHSGDDLYRFEQHPRDRAGYCVSQVISSCNYHCGHPVGDYLQIWLNYQIEHHLFPRLSMLAYRQIQPEVKATCERFGVPYVQESVFRRFRQLVRVMIGDGQMRRLVSAIPTPAPTLPPAPRAATA